MPARIERRKGENVRLMTLLLILVAIGGGSLVVIQTSINARMRLQADSPWQAALVSTTVSTVFLFTVSAVITRHPYPPVGKIHGTPWWIWTGGLLGAIYVALTLVLVKKLGSGVLFSAVVLGQMVAALLIDQFGLIGRAKHEISAPRVFGVVMIVSGVALVRSFRKGRAVDAFERWLQSSSDVEEAAELTASLVGIRSLPGEEAEVQAFVEKWLDQAGLNPVSKDVVPNRPNVTATIENGPGPMMMFNGHVDTAIIDPTWDPARLWGKREGDRLYGLGAGDMKPGVAAAMLAARALDQRRDLWRGTLVLTSVIDEEAFSLGAHAVIDSGLRPDYSVVTESTLPAALLGSFGKVLVRIDVTGHAAHASMPHQGINAAVEAARFTARLSEGSARQPPKIKPVQSVLSFHSGPTTYQSITVPDQARMLINWHTAPGESADDVIARLKTLADSLDSPASFAFSIDPPYYPAWEQPVDSPLIEAFADAIQLETGKPPVFAYTGYGDTNLFSDVGIPTMMFGAQGANYHQANEWVDVDSIGR